MHSQFKTFLDDWAARKLGVPEEEVTLEMMRERLRSPSGLKRIDIESRVGGRIDNHLESPSDEEIEQLLRDADELLTTFKEDH